jgi:dihydrofolate reductase
VILSLVAAVAQDGAIGFRGAIPWDIAEDRALFRRLTWGHPLLVGRRTFEAIGGPLPGREMVVLSRNRDFAAGPCRVAPTLEDALAPYLGTGEEVFVGGGAQVYAATLPLAHRLYLTRVPGAYEGDAFFPEVDWAQWAAARSEVLPGPSGCRFLLHERKDMKEKSR